MSPTESTTTPAPASATGGGAGAKVTKAVAAVVAVAVLALGASQISKSNATTATGGAAMQQTGGPPGGAAPGGAPGGMTPPGMGTEVTGSTLAKLESAATAKYPGTVERAMELQDGSYVVHVVQSDGDGEVHVLVSKDFEVTGVQQGGPPAGATGRPPSSSQSAPSTGSDATGEQS